MIEETREWLTKAEGDFASATREVKARIHRNEDSACFHCQQCIEKLMKGLLVEINVPFPKTHDLGSLLDLASPQFPSLELLRECFDMLTDYAISFRYPGENATREQSNSAYSECCKLRSIIKSLLNP